MIKIAFFDIDGTLVNPKTKAISPRTVYALNKLRENGIITVIATGRAPSELPDFQGINFEAFLTYNGSYCFDDEGNCLFSNSMDSNDIEIITKNATKLGRHVVLCNENRLIPNGLDSELIEYVGFANIVMKMADDFDTMIHSNIYQLMVSTPPQEYDALMEGTSHSKIACWWDKATDVVPKDSGKGKAIAKILEHYHLTKEDAIAFGDGNNDIEMFEQVGVGVAMENGSETLKNIATTICKSVDEDGVYDYCFSEGLL